MTITTIDNLKLKPCPFCGSTKITLWHGFGVGGKCDKCGADSGHNNYKGKTKADAAAAWNKRVKKENRED